MFLHRYVGENYSDAQQAMEDVMQTFYSQSSKQQTITNPAIGQLVAVRGEDGEEMARAQVKDVSNPNKIKVTCSVSICFSLEQASCKKVYAASSSLCPGLLSLKCKNSPLQFAFSCIITFQNKYFQYPK